MIARSAAALFGILLMASALACRSSSGPPPAPAATQNLAALEDDARQGRTTAEENLLLAKAWVNSGAHQKALDLLDTLTSGDQTFQNRRHILRGQALEGTDRRADAWSAYEAALAAVPGDASALLREAAFSYRAGDGVRALRLAQQSLSRQPGNPEAYYLLYVLETDTAARNRALLNLAATDGPDGPWTARAIADRPR